jgi:uncharacterized LabA/DUF88 family protein
VVFLRLILTRVSSFIDGFNLYHSIHDLRKNYLKWVNLWDLSSAFIKPSKEKINNVFYFSAYATWLEDAYRRHQLYVQALEHFGITTVLGQFKQKQMKCHKCKASWISREEKESDVNMAVYLLHHAYLDTFDKALIVTADSDLIPPIKLIQKQFPNKEIVILSPPNRYRISKELRNSVQTIRIREKHLANNLLPSEIKTNNGIVLRPEQYQI